MLPMNTTLAVGFPTIANSTNMQTVKKPAIAREAANSGIPKKSATISGKLDMSIGVFSTPLYIYEYQIEYEGGKQTYNPNPEQLKIPFLN